MKRMLLSVFALAFFPALGAAEAACSAAPTTYQAILECAEIRSPDIQNAKFELEAAEKAVRAAGQWKNPEIAAETFRGRVGGENRQETDVSLGIPIEIGGKISAREALAKGGVSLAQAQLFAARARVRAEAFVKLHRLRQVIHERELVDEASRTFSKLIDQYKRRPGLSPEQQVSSSVFQLSKSEYDLKASANLDEQLALDSYFKLTIGFSADEIKQAVPESPNSWPRFSPSANPKTSVRQQLLQADLDTAKAQFEVAKSESWPTLNVGPSIKLVEESRVSDQMIGFNVSLPIPVFNVNGGGRAAAAAGVKVSETRKQYGLREQQLHRDELLKIYEQSVKALSSSLSHKEIERRHNDAEKLFYRGIVPSALVIEAHRTSYELERTRHEREIKAIEALLALYTIEGTILENIL